MCGVDICSRDVTEETGILTVQDKCAVQDVEKQMDITRVGEVASHGFKHPCNQSHPHEFMEHVEAK